MTETIHTTPMMQAIDEASRTGAKKFRSKTQPQEWGLISLRECPLPSELKECTCPAQAASYWNTHVRSNPYFNPEVECFVVLLLNVRRKIKGHVLVSTGLMDQVLIHPRETFRAAVIASAHSVILMHNLCDASHKLCCVQRGVMWIALGGGRKNRGLACVGRPCRCT